MTDTDRDPQRTPVPTDVEAPDKIIYGLTFRQLAILGAAGGLAWLAWRGLNALVPGPVLLVGLVAWMGLAAAVALGRRDGLSLDAWLLAALRAARAPHRLAPGEASVPAPAWAPEAAEAAPPALLRLPATAISPDGPIALDDGHVGLVACSSVNVALRTDAEQAALIDSYGRWLNSLSGPAQIVVSAQPVDLAGRAAALADAAPRLPHPALEAAARDHATFLTELAEGREPLRRTTLIACHAGGPTAERDAARAAERAGRAMTGLGAAARVLDGPAAAGALAAAVDPYAPPAAPTRAAPTTPVTRRSP